MLRQFRKEHPKIRLLVRSGNTEHIVEALIDQHVSLGLIEGPTRRRDVLTEPFLDDELVLTVPGSNDVADQTTVAAAAFRRFALEGKKRRSLHLDKLRHARTV